MAEALQAGFDTIIIGAGSAGCVLAARLSADPLRRVLLLEAGPSDRSWRIDMPAAVGSLISSERFNWNYVSDPEPFLDGRRLTHPRGRVLGGSSSINGMMYVRGHARDYDAWAAAGLDGWSYADVLPYFKRAEAHLLGGDEYHGASGPLGVCAPDLGAAPLAQRFVQAAVQAGYALASDVNGERQEGAGRMDRTTQGGRRCSAARAYLHPVRDRMNLSVRTEVRVGRILIESGRAVGVAWRDAGGAHEARAAAEVILAAGAIGSPQLLQLSGVGPPQLLRSLGIPVLHELPAVGENLNDHPDLAVQHRCLRPLSLYRVNHGLPRILTGLRWFARADGPASSNHFEAGAFLRSRAGIEHPDIQLTFMPLAIRPGTVRDVGCDSFQVHIDLLRPRSLGRVMLRSADPAAAPSILFNYLADPEDRADLRAGVRLTREILAQPALDDVRGEELNPGVAVSSDAALDAWIRQGVETCYHPVGSCRMGRRAQDSVVDARGRVHGLAGLRIVDASIMPGIVSGNTNAPVIMMAEKLSDDIQGCAPLPPLAAPAWIHPDWANAQR
jgi:choline dehydrogenase